jgi:aerotaxis receptor
MKTNLPVTNRERTFDDRVRIISTTDHKGTLTAYNNEFLDISGFDEDELIGKNHNVVRHPDMPSAAFADLWQTIKGGQSWMGIVKNRCKNGDFYWVDAFVTPISENGQISEYQSVRAKPSAERVKRAELVYKKINNNQKPFRKGLSFSARLYLSVVATLLPVVLMSFIAPQFVLLGVLLSLALGTGLIFLQLRPLMALVEDARKNVNNPLMQYIYTGRRDEIGQLMLTQKMVRSQLDAVVSRLDFSTDTLSETAGHTSTIAMKSRDGIHEQQLSIQEIATAITEMSAAVMEVARNAQETAEATHHADTEADKGRRTVTSTINAINSLTQEITAAAEIIHRLGSESQAISGVLVVIKSIAEQTNLLALNAAIEAARAGEQGRGFAVVADEVRSLAVRTQASITEIEEMIGRVQASTKAATQAMEQSCAKAQQSSEQSATISDFLSTITESVNNINGMTLQIANSAEEQSAVSAEIRNNVNRISHQAEESVVIAAESGSVSQELTTLTVQLKKLVRQFQKSA